MFLLSMSSLICIIDDCVSSMHVMNMHVMNIHDAFLVWYKIKLNLILIVAQANVVTRAK
jgi:hypothetical protein